MASSTSPFTYEAVEVIFGSIYFYFHIQTAPNLQDCPHSDNLTTFPDFTLSALKIFCSIKITIKISVQLRQPLVLGQDEVGHGDEGVVVAPGDLGHLTSME